MARDMSLGEQLKGMLDAMKYYNDSTSTVGGSTDSSSSGLMSLLWPLLPLLPPEPPRLVKELLGRHDDACDVCGLPGKGLVPVDTNLRQRFTHTTPLDKLMADIEKKMEETLNSIETTTKKNEELNKQRKELDQSAKSDLADAEMLKKLKSLVDEKASREERVKSLEVKEQQLKDSLMTAINWAKDIEMRKLSDEKDAHQEMADDEEPNQQSKEVARA